jgi:hypothetical protein
MLLLQTQVSGTLDALEICAWLLGIIVVLIGVIWRSNESKAGERHQDLLKLINNINARQDQLDLRQDQLQEFQRNQQTELLSTKYELTTLRTVVNILQGKPIILHSDEEKKTPGR